MEKPINEFKVKILSILSQDFTWINTDTDQFIRSINKVMSSGRIISSQTERIYRVSSEKNLFRLK